MSIIEGFGDEVLFCFVVLALIGIFTLSWLSTSVRPVWNPGSVWLVQLQTHPNRRVLQVLSVDERNLDQVQPPLNVGTDSETRQIIVEPGSHEILHPENDSNTPVESISRSNSNSDANEAEKQNETEPTVQDVPESDNGESSTIKIKFLDDTHKLVRAWLTQTVGQFKRQHFTTEVGEGKTVRLIYKGQLLRDDGRSLESYGLHDNCVVHCHVGNVPYSQPQASASATATGPQPAPAAQVRRVNNFDVGRYAYLIFGLKIIAVWTAAYFYPHFFNKTSVVSLMGCTALYALFVYGGRRNNNINNNNVPLQ